MRQAGRSLPEYRRIRAGVDMIDSCLDSELVTEITMQPVRRHGVDAAILFSDIVVPLHAIGVGLSIEPGVGPVIESPIRTAADLARLRPLEPDDVAPVLQGVKSLVAELGATPLIGFAGAPFTLASYLVEGGPSRNHALTKSLMKSEPQMWHQLLERLADLAGEFLRFQVEAGASVVQLFDSWVGALSVRDYRQYVAPHSARAFAAVADTGVPRIHFGVGTGELLADMATVGVDVIGVDFRIPLDVAAQRTGHSVAVQGNLDPALLLADSSALWLAVDDVLEQARGVPGHIFNLGHGMLPATDPGVPGAIVERVHAAGAPEFLSR
ncbi:MAG: uroporphyrinogen decarboxylase, partial [Candidatus Nanopelagicales bacterium]|nr:uroporphyrinogen decarboxylase [Candidatus Nanopelagicales bacterium]